MYRFPSKNKKADSGTHRTHHRTHATLLFLQYDLNILSRFDWEILHLKGYRLHGLISIGSFFWCHYPKVCMIYSYVIYWLTQSNFSAFTPLCRNGQVWHACIAPVPSDLQRLPLHTVNHTKLYSVGRPYSLPLSNIEEDEIAHVVIDTVFDPLAAKNKCFKPHTYATYASQCRSCQSTYLALPHCSCTLNSGQSPSRSSKQGWIIDGVCIYCTFHPHTRFFESLFTGCTQKCRLAWRYGYTLAWR
jgi:hypothetical protein